MTVEQNIIFNQDDVPNVDKSAVIQDEAQSEGKRQKLIQAPLNNANNKTEKHDEEQQVNDQPTERSPKTHPKPQSSNSIAFPSIQEPQIEVHTESQDKDQSANN